MLDTIKSYAHSEQLHLSPGLQPSNMVGDKDLLSLRVNFECDGVLLRKDIIKDQKIFIPRNSWLQLIESRPTIDEHLTNKKEKNWRIGNNLRASISIFNDKCYIHIRRWFRDHPTKEGVTLHTPEWSYLSSYLCLDKEHELGISSLVNIMSQDLNNFLKQNCDGCKNSWNSQTDHLCLTIPLEDVKERLNTVFQKVEYKDFLMELALQARQKNTVIKRPFETFYQLLWLKEDDIKNRILTGMS